MTGRRRGGRYTPPARLARAAVEAFAPGLAAARCAHLDVSLHCPAVAR